MAFAPAVWLAVQEELCGDNSSETKPENYFDDFEDEELFQMFHLTRPCINFITDYVSHQMTKTHDTKQTSHSPCGMVMTALDYYANGIVSTKVQNKVGLNPLETPEVIYIVSKVLSGMVSDFVTFPRTRDSRANVANDIKNFCGMPNVLGVVACLHARVRPAHLQPELFRNTLGFLSVMIQIICDCEGNILSVEECCVGSTPQQNIWNTSVIGSQFKRGVHGTNWIIAGSGYTQGCHLLTPVSPANSEPEKRFNSAHAKVLRMMQETITSLKKRFLCLKFFGYAQQDGLDKKGDVMNACCVLHNIAKKFSVPSVVEPGENLETMHPGAQFRDLSIELPLEMAKARDDIIAGYFSVSGATV
ncbi:putative nuclease HARBI1 [Osmerus eperlanus]|uniref:putative nuclease HARBI1 n=1 Tax=Osmerus eperlanus TaxID=29151 RepID=UPI002E13635A